MLIRAGAVKDGLIVLIIARDAVHGDGDLGHTGGGFGHPGLGEVQGQVLGLVVVDHRHVLFVLRVGVHDGILAVGHGDLAVVHGDGIGLGLGLVKVAVRRHGLGHGIGVPGGYVGDGDVAVQRGAGSGSAMHRVSAGTVERELRARHGGPAAVFLAEAEASQVALHSGDLEECLLQLGILRNIAFSVRKYIGQLGLLVCGIELSRRKAAALSFQTNGILELIGVEGVLLAFHGLVIAWAGGILTDGPGEGAVLLAGDRSADRSFDLAELDHGAHGVRNLPGLAAQGDRGVDVVVDDLQLVGVVRRVILIHRLVAILPARAHHVVAVIAQAEAHGVKGGMRVFGLQHAGLALCGAFAAIPIIVLVCLAVRHINHVLGIFLGAGVIRTGIQRLPRTAEPGLAVCGAIIGTVVVQIGFAQAGLIGHALLIDIILAHHIIVLKGVDGRLGVAGPVADGLMDCGISKHAIPPAIDHDRDPVLAVRQQPGDKALGRCLQRSPAGVGKLPAPPTWRCPAGGIVHAGGHVEDQDHVRAGGGGHGGLLLRGLHLEGDQELVFLVSPGNVLAHDHVSVGILDRLCGRCSLCPRLNGVIGVQFDILSDLTVIGRCERRRRQQSEYHDERQEQGQHSFLAVCQHDSSS